MAMSVQIESCIITEGKEKRVKENNFELILDGYHLYPMDVSIPVKRGETKEPIGEGIIRSLLFSKEKTTIVYTLATLKNIN
ncbi:DUF2584 domain-containing protein [Caldibacillus thermolactis]|jgi:hypothetical protein|uniref:DUF2584 domain-containing protein n=1 Tax=Pallidibacillus thermolactis TaxID=251051 RepID=A0ABT2WGB3_9BACI|nr:DUF2584 family protein [Pallidibacillus thermolactis]MCU9594744.1 DUF2584 domain-containing protein [Pallidibacillus thermolactis]MCU9601100.1 DUF2584 domain-containing protein [Pallidibacillus thermolactis subsp. kokeshiiformis]MED1672731.1 DUF2584 family protein [Pallidibacillus thermolactis subsp. kokeshiiformis]